MADRVCLFGTPGSCPPSAAGRRSQGPAPGPRQRLAALDRPSHGGLLAPQTPSPGASAPWTRSPLAPCPGSLTVAGAPLGRWAPSLGTRAGRTGADAGRGRGGGGGGRYVGCGHEAVRVCRSGHQGESDEVHLVREVPEPWGRPDRSGNCSLCTGGISGVALLVRGGGDCTALTCGFVRGCVSPRTHSGSPSVYLAVTFSGKLKQRLIFDGRSPARRSRRSACWASGSEPAVDIRGACTYVSPSRQPKSSRRVLSAPAGPETSATVYFWRRVRTGRGPRVGSGASPRQKTSTR